MRAVDAISRLSLGRIVGHCVHLGLFSFALHTQTVLIFGRQPKRAMPQTGRMSHMSCSHYAPILPQLCVRTLRAISSVAAVQHEFGPYEHGGMASIVETQGVLHHANTLERGSV